MKDGIEIFEIFSLLRKKSGMILSCIFSGVLIAWGITEFIITPRYQSSVQMVVNNAGEGEQLNQGDIHSSWNLINTYREILLSPVVLNEVVNELALPFSASTLRGQLSVTSPNQTQIISLSVLNEDPALAKEIVNSIAETFQEVIFDIFNTRNVFIIMEGEESLHPATPNRIMNLAIGVTLGMVAGLTMTFLIYYLDTRIKHKQELEQLLDIPVMGTIPNLEAKNFK